MVKNKLMTSGIGSSTPSREWAGNLGIIEMSLKEEESGGQDIQLPQVVVWGYFFFLPTW